MKIKLIALGIVLTGLILLIVIQNNKINKLSQANQIQAVELSTLKDSVLIHKSKNNELTFKLASVEIEKSSLKESLDLMGIDRQALKERDIKWRKITAALRAELAASGHGETNVVDTFRIEKTDTIYFQKVNDWTNNYLSLFNAEIVNKKLNFDYTYKTNIDFITTGTRKETVVSVILSDPKAQITTANSITIKNDKKWYERPVIWTVVGIGAGVLITK